ncbi:helix-turn-helix transcriptional regulator [Cellulosimicrobium funkei]|nr:helix-turn-helix transcriptional regulator [Cellulosimicrobium funkei]
MPIIVDVDVMMARRKMSAGDLAEAIGITPANLAVLKNGRAKAVRFTTLAALCRVLDCQPGDLLRWEAGGDAVGPGAQDEDPDHGGREDHRGRGQDGHDGH